MVLELNIPTMMHICGVIEWYHRCPFRGREVTLRLLPLLAVMKAQYCVQNAY